ncbi:MAG: response regulator containing a CheY-like receiver domain and an DNA-binding domain [Solirubrobacterales bacterium]|nr:response regulator containing a CheY-like receiver domain and an DNA-binding domain [Solirubrobacterales bacterium]
MAITCLIVDDNAAFLRVARDLLERQGVAVVGMASTSAEALLRADELRPDVMLVDIELAGESGFDLTDRLASVPCDRRSPVILVSTYAEKDFADLIATSPAVGFLSKSTLSGTAISEVLARADGPGLTDPR